MRKGDVFALMLPNVPEFATPFYGVLAAGGVVTTINPLYTPDEIAHQLSGPWNDGSTWINSQQS
jgi:acyl-CoA synthetase (AMP-forming)/AMP-acid ligase II